MLENILIILGITLIIILSIFLFWLIGIFIYCVYKRKQIDRTIEIYYNKDKGGK